MSRLTFMLWIVQQMSKQIKGHNSWINIFCDITNKLKAGYAYININFTKRIKCRQNGKYSPTQGDWLSGEKRN